MLKCISPYKATRIAFQPGDIIDNPALEAHLLIDSPGSFERVEPVTKPVKAAPVDRMVTKTKRK